MNTSCIDHTDTKYDWIKYRGLGFGSVIHMFGTVAVSEIFFVTPLYNGWPKMHRPFHITMFQ